MDIVLNRQGGVSLRDQLVIQLELKLLTGALGAGARLPSVRTLARRLELHPNTVSAAYRDLEASGHVELRRGAGVFVRSAEPSSLQEARGLDEMIRVSLQTAFRKGYSGPEIRAAVERWLAAVPPERVLVVDPAREMAELLGHEIRQSLEVGVSSCRLEEVAADPSLLSGALTLALPYHVESLRRLAPAAAIAELTLRVSEQDRDTISALPSGSVVLVVSHAPTVIPFASVFLKSLRGDDVVVEARLLSDSEGWLRLIQAADVVLADTLSVDVVRRARPRKLQGFQVVPGTVLDRLRKALERVVAQPAVPGRGDPGAA
jgi:DNA-binding transcriptional regulator YhcF (GntR family)